jgi:Domain of unknown function (DUF4845)
MVTLPRAQRGMTLIGWVVVLMLIGFFALLAMRLIPVYLENYTVKSTLKSLENEPEITKKSPYEIRRLIDNRLYINYINTVDAKQFSIVQKGGRTTVSVEYEVERPFIGNVYLLMKFHDTEEIIAH